MDRQMHEIRLSFSVLLFFILWGTPANQSKIAKTLDLFFQDGECCTRLSLPFLALPSQRPIPALLCPDAPLMHPLSPLGEAPPDRMPPHAHRFAWEHPSPLLRVSRAAFLLGLRLAKVSTVQRPLGNPGTCGVGLEWFFRGWGGGGWQGGGAQLPWHRRPSPSASPFAGCPRRPTPPRSGSNGRPPRSSRLCTPARVSIGSHTWGEAFSVCMWICLLSEVQKNGLKMGERWVWSEEGCPALIPGQKNID